MVFSSLFFLFLFLPLNLVLYFIIKNKNYRNGILIVMSLAFYAWGEPIWISILILSTLVDYFNGLLAEKYRGQWQSKAAVVSSLVFNLSLLGFFKYAGFLVENINELTGLQIPFSGFALPIGISFYTFQTISYVIDVYRGEVPAQKSFFKLLLFVSLFHQLVAGPIVRYKDIAAEIDHRVIQFKGFSQGISRFVMGLGKKVIFANTAGELAKLFLDKNPGDLSVLGSWYGIALFALQIYFDFSGYSDMAIGLGKMFGFTYKENFDYPYISRSATEFWRRWHISLGSFFRDYVYIPLGGNRRFNVRNLIIVWFLTGLWHGASWNFILWGVYYGFLIILEKLFINNLFRRIPEFFSHVYLLVSVLIGWVFFYYIDLGSAFSFLGIMFGFAANPFVNSEFSITFLNNVVYFIVAIVGCTPLLIKIHQSLLNSLKNNTRLTLVYSEGVLPLLSLGLLFVSTVLLVGSSYNPFLYFRF